MRVMLVVIALDSVALR